MLARNLSTANIAPCRERSAMLDFVAVAIIP
jgi:hypothetical protein